MDYKEEVRQIMESQAEVEACHSCGTKDSKDKYSQCELCGQTSD